MIKHITEEASKINISFCLPVYNVENYLEDCIKSIVSQFSYDFAYEIVCVDDFSTDNSYNILKDMEKNIPQLRIIKNEVNRGVSYTRNKLISLAKGKCIWFVDPDDMLYPNVAKLFFEKIEKSNLNVILGNYMTCPENTEFDSFDKNKMTDTSCFQEMSVANENFLPCSQTAQKMCTVCCGIFRKDFLEKNNLLFKENMIAQEDTLFYYEFSLRLEKIIKYNGPCYIYRQRNSSVMHSKSPERSVKYYNSMCIMYDTYMQHLLSGDYREKEVLLNKIHHMQQNLAVTLAGVPNTKFVKYELKRLKSNKIYPYPFRKESLKTKENLLRRIIFFLQPIELFFWFLHALCKIDFISKHST